VYTVDSQASKRDINPWHGPGDAGIVGAMEGHPLWRASTFSVSPTRSRAGLTAEIKDAAGGALAICDPDGTVRDASGGVLLQAPVRWEARRNRPLDVEMGITDLEGRALGTARVVKYGLGPRAKKATVALIDGQGTEVARLEPQDKKGERLAVSAGGADLATVDVAEIKTGFLQKARVYTATLPSEIAEDIRPLVLAAIVRYYALLEGLEAASLKADARG
jgi:hypothetical protein